MFTFFVYILLPAATSKAAEHIEIQMTKVQRQEVMTQNVSFQQGQQNRSLTMLQLVSVFQRLYKIPVQTQSKMHSE